MIISVRFVTGTYVARAKGQKVTASCTVGAHQAAEALARKLGLAPDGLVEQPDMLNPNQHSTFTHPGDLLEEVANG